MQNSEQPGPIPARGYTMYRGRATRNLRRQFRAFERFFFCRGHNYWGQIVNLVRKGSEHSVPGYPGIRVMSPPRRKTRLCQSCWVQPGTGTPRICFGIPSQVPASRHQEYTPFLYSPTFPHAPEIKTQLCPFLLLKTKTLQVRLYTYPDT
eukprot:1590915-Rhodomonas_salina.1